MDIESGRKRVAKAWANPRAAGVSMNVDLVQSVAHILVRECLQAKIDTISEVVQFVEDNLGKNDEQILLQKLEEMNDDFQTKLDQHNEEGISKKRVFEVARKMEEAQ